MEKIKKEDAYQNRKCIRRLYQASGRPTESLGGATCWLADQSGSYVITGQKVEKKLKKGYEQRVCVRAVALPNAYIYVAMVI